MDSTAFVAIHEAGHATLAVLRGVRLRHVGLLHGNAERSGECAYDIGGRFETRADTLATLTDLIVISAGGPVAETLAGRRNGPGDQSDEGDFELIEMHKRHAARFAPPGWEPPAAVTVAREELSCPVAWAGVVTLARLIVSRNGVVDGPTATAAIKAGFRDRELVDAVLMNGTRAVV